MRRAGASIGIEPGGDNGTYFQTVPFYQATVQVPAADIHDEADWKYIVRNLALAAVAIYCGVRIDP